jgi:hypothetical protein
MEMIKYARTILNELFYVLTGALVIFVILEFAWPRVVLAYININWVLIFWLLTGILILILNSENKGNNER